jgi:hypothetical protein
VKNDKKYPLPIRIATGVVISSIVLCSAQAAGSDVEHYAFFQPRGHTVFESLVQLGLQEHIPFGFVVEDNDRDLCATESQPQADFRNVPVSEILNGLLRNTNSQWLVRDGVVTIKPIRARELTTKILDMKFDTFGGMKTTMQGLGIILSGYIQSGLVPDQGRFGDILSNDSNEMIEPFSLRDVTMEQTADHIVTSGSKGIWYLRVPKSTSAQPDPE